MSKCDLPLHGLTVVIDTTGPRVYVGRFDVETDKGVLLRDADVRDVGDEAAKAAYFAKCAKYGVFKNTDQVWVPPSEISSIRRLSEIEPAV